MDPYWAQVPWMRNARWSSGVIRDQSAENLTAIWTFTLAWNIVTALALVPRIKQGIDGHGWSRLLALIFPGIGLGLLIWAIRHTRRITQFGASAFHLTTLPATPGGDLAGTIHVERKFQPKSGIQLQLTCIFRFLSGFGRNARVIDRVVWREAQTLDSLPPREDGTDIPVLFHLPPDARPSSDLAMGDGIRWKLQARCKTTGVTYYSRFEVPVFVVASPRLAAVAGRDVAASRRSTEPSDPRGNLRERGIICERFAGGRLRIHLAAGRNKPSGIITAVIGSALIAMGVALASRPGLLVDRAITTSFASAFIFVGGVFECIAIFNWLVTEEITVRYGSLTAERRTPLSLQQRTFKLGDVSDVLHKIQGHSSSASGSGAWKKKIRYGLLLKTRDGDRVWLAHDIIQKDYAAWLAEQIKDVFGVAT